MAAYDTLRAAIDSYIKANGNKEITGTVLNDILNAMVSALGADTRFAGVAVPTTNPGNPEGNVVYFASQAGTYSNFGGIILPLGIHILVWNGTAWTSQTWFSVDNTPTQNSQNLATSGGILQAIVDAVGVERLRAIGAEVTSCSFDGTTKKISFFNSADDTLFQLDATAFVIDGMVSDVKIEDGNLVIQFNTDAGKQDIEIPLTDIFNPANYYTKTAIDALLALYYTKTETDALLTVINNKLADGCLYRGMAEPTTNPPTPTTKVFYIATKAGTYTNFGNIAVTEGISILKYDGSDWSKEQISYSDGVFDISAYNGTSYADLSEALGTDGANIPQNLRKGGMSVKYVQTSDNNYVQFRLMSDTFSTTESDWQGVDNEPILQSKNLIESGGVIDFISKNLGVPFVENKTLHSGDIIFNSGTIPTGKNIVFDFNRGYVTVKNGNEVVRYIGTTLEATKTTYTIPSNVTDIIVGSQELVVNEIKVLDVKNNKELTEEINAVEDYFGYQKVVLKGIGTSGIGLFTQVGDCYYNTSLNKIARCTSYTDSEHFGQENSDPKESVVYIIGTNLYVYNGITLVEIGTKKNNTNISRNVYDINQKISDTLNLSIPECGTYAIWQPNNIPDIYTSANDATVTAPLEYNEFINQFYDNLVGTYDNGYVVTKSILGETRGSTKSYPIYEYEFIPPKYNRIVMLSAGMNANELTPIFALAYFINKVVNSSVEDPTGGLSYFYENVKFKVIPIINVWGYCQEHLVYKNINGVNINLNWDFNDSWATMGSTNPEAYNYKGTTPDSEYETKLLKQWLFKNGKSADLWIDCHSGVGTNTPVENLKTFYTIASPKSLKNAILAVQEDIIDYYEALGYSPSEPACGNGMSYPKTANAFDEFGVKGIMIEQYPNAPGYGGCGATDRSLQNHSVDIANYIMMIRTYALTALNRSAANVDFEKLSTLLWQWNLENRGREDNDANYVVGGLNSDGFAVSDGSRHSKMYNVHQGDTIIITENVSGLLREAFKYPELGNNSGVRVGVSNGAITTTISNEQYFAFSMACPPYKCVRSNDVIVEFNGISDMYEYSHRFFNNSHGLSVAGGRTDVLSPLISITEGTYQIELKDGFTLSQARFISVNDVTGDALTFTTISQGKYSLNIQNIPADKPYLAIWLKKTDNSAIKLSETVNCAKVFKILES